MNLCDLLHSSGWSMPICLSSCLSVLRGNNFYVEHYTQTPQRTILYRCPGASQLQQRVTLLIKEIKTQEIKTQSLTPRIKAWLVWMSCAVTYYGQICVLPLCNITYTTQVLIAIETVTETHLIISLYSHKCYEPHFLLKQTL